MNNERFMENIVGDELTPQNITMIEADNMAVGIFLNQMPNVDTLHQIKHLFESEDAVSTEEHQILPVYFTVDGGATVQQIGRIHLTIDKHLRLERLLARYGLELCYVINGIKGGAIPRETLISTIKLSPKSIYDYI